MRNRLKTQVPSLLPREQLFKVVCFDLRDPIEVSWKTTKPQKDYTELSAISTPVSRYRLIQSRRAVRQKLFPAFGNIVFPLHHIPPKARETLNYKGLHISASIGLIRGPVLALYDVPSHDLVWQGIYNQTHVQQRSGHLQ